MIPWRQTNDDDEENHINICDEFFFEIMNLFVNIILFVLNMYTNNINYFTD